MTQSMRDLTDLVSFNSLSEEHLSTLHTLIAEGKEEELENYCTLNEFDLSKVKKWAATGALAAALGLSAAGSADAGQWHNGGGWGQPHYSNHDSGRASSSAGKVFGKNEYVPFQHYPEYRRAPAPEYRPHWRNDNPWASSGRPVPKSAFGFDFQGQDIVFIAHPTQSDFNRARRLGEMTTLRVPGWPNPVSAFVYEANGVAYVVPLPGQLP
jgi:hypothetical protein